MEEALIQYTFFGKVFPERANVTIPSLELILINDEAGINGKLKISIQVSQITALFRTHNKVENIFTLRNYIEDAIRLEIDILGYLFGCGYDIEITTMVDSEGQEPIVFGVSIWEIENQKEERPKNLFEILSLFNGPKGDYLRRCFSDLREAIRVPKDSGFFCYRAIETLRQFFVHEFNCNNDRESWELLRGNLKIDRANIEFIKSYADPIRHGNTKYIAAEHRSQVLLITWKVVDEFILYASNGYKPI